MRTRTTRLLSILLAGALLLSCTAQVPSEQPAVDALVRQYDQRTGTWPTTGWWNSANALTALTNYMIASGDLRYLWVVENTYSKKINAAQGNFINDFTDDTGWWALAWISAYDLTGEGRYLQTARRAIDFMWSHHDNYCGGGLWWTTRHTYKNAVTNELFIKAAAQLSQRVGQDGEIYLQRAISVWEWFDATGMIDGDLLIHDGLNTASCAPVTGDVWTYNQGVILGGLIALAVGTGDSSYLDRARQLADASIASEVINIDGILTEPCERDGCDVNGPSFKGIYVRNLGELNLALEDHPYSDYLAEQANTSYEENRSPNDEYGLHWAGPLQGISGATQQSAVDLLVAAQPIDESEVTSDTG